MLKDSDQQIVVRIYKLAALLKATIAEKAPDFHSLSECDEPVTIGRGGKIFSWLLMLCPCHAESNVKMCTFDSRCIKLKYIYYFYEIIKI